MASSLQGSPSKLFTNPNDFITVSSMRPNSRKIREHFLPSKIVYVHFHEDDIPRGFYYFFMSFLNKLFPSIYFDLKETLPENLDAPLLIVENTMAGIGSSELIESLKSYANTTYLNHPIIGVRIGAIVPTILTRKPDGMRDLYVESKKSGSEELFSEYVMREKNKTPELFSQVIDTTPTSTVYRAITMNIIYDPNYTENFHLGKNMLLSCIALSHWLAYVCNTADAFIARSRDLLMNPIWQYQNYGLYNRFKIAYHQITDGRIDPPKDPSPDEWFDPVYDMSDWFKGLPAYENTALRPMKKKHMMSFFERKAYKRAVASDIQKETLAGTSVPVVDDPQKSSKRSQRSDGPSSLEERSEKISRIQSEIARLSALIGDLMT